MRALLILAIAFSGCAAGKSTAQKDHPMTEPQVTAGPPTLVYKTKKDYSNNVPVLLSEDKRRIVSYPHPADIRNADGYRPAPTALAGGYLLDNRGIGLNVAFLKLTWDEYAKMEKAPPLAEMMDLIADDDPLTELCNCGSRQAFAEPEQQLNALISTGQLRSKCKVIR